MATEQIIQEQQQFKPDFQGGDPIDKLYQVAKEKKLYSKSLDEFKQKYSTPESIDYLYSVVSGGKPDVYKEKLYTKSKDDFYNQYFPTLKKKEQAPWGLSYQRQKASSMPAILPSRVKEREKEITLPAGIQQVKDYKKDERITDLTPEQQNQKGANILLDIMYKEGNDWKDPIGTLESKIKSAKTTKEAIEFGTARGMAERELLLDGANAKRLLNESIWGKMNNATTQKLKERADKYDKIVAPLRNIQVPQGADISQANEEFLKNNFGRQIGNAAIQIYAEKHPSFKKELQATGLDINDPLLYNKLDSYKAGAIKQEVFNDHDVASYLNEENPDLLPAFQVAQKDLLKDDKKFGVNQVANKVSRLRQKEGLNDVIGTLYDENAKGATNAVAEKYLSPEELEIYNNEIKDKQEDYIDTPSLLTGFSQSGKDFFKGIGKTFTQPFTSASETVKEGWDKEARNVSADPKGAAKFMNDAGHALGIVASIAGTGNVIGGATGLNATNAGTIGTVAGFFGDQLEQGKMKYPDSPVKAWTSGVFNTALYAALSRNIFPTAKINQAFKNVSPEINQVVENLTNGTITREAAREQMATLFKQATDIAGRTLKQDAKIAGELTGISALNRGLDAIMMPDDEQFEKYHPEDELTDTFTSMALSNAFVAGLSGFGEARGKNKIAEESYYEAASNPKQFERVIEESTVKDPSVKKEELLGNLKFLSSLKETLDAGGVEEKNQKRFLKNAIREKVLSEQENADKSLQEKNKKELNEIKNENEKILQGEDVENIVSIEETEKAEQQVKDEATRNKLIEKGHNAIDKLLAEVDENDKPKFKGIYRDIAKGDPLGFLKEVAEQAQGIDTEGKELAGGGRELEMIPQYGADVINIAKELFPKNKIKQNEYAASNEEIRGEQTGYDGGQKEGIQREQPTGQEGRLEGGEENNAKGQKEVSRTEKDFSKDNENYRVIVGDESFNDLLSSGVVRTNAESKPQGESGIDLGNRPTAFPSFSKGQVSIDYANKNPNHYIIVSDDAAIKPSTLGRHGKGTTMFPTDAEGNPLKEISGEKVKVYKHVGNGKYELVYDKGQEVVNSKGAAVIRPEENKPPNIVETVKVKEEVIPQPEEPTRTQEEGKVKGEEIPPISEPPQGTRISAQYPNTELTHRGLQVVANEFSLPDVKTRERKSDIELRKEAEVTANDWLAKGEYGKKVEGLVQKAEGGDILTDKERVILEQHLANVSGELRSMDISNPNYDVKLAEIKRLKDAGERTRSEAGAALRKPSGGSQPKDIGDWMVEEMDISGTEKLTEQQKETVQKEYNEITELEKRYQEKVQALEAENNRLRAEQSVKSTAASTKKQPKKDYKKERDEIFTSIKDKLKKSRGELSATPIPYLKELIVISPDVAKLVKSYVEQGVTELSSIIKNIHNDLKEDIEGITEKDVRDLIAGVYNQKKVTRNELAATLKNLRDESILINKLEALERGEEPKSERKKVERNKQIAELRKKVKESDVTKLGSYKDKIKRDISRVEEQIRSGNFEKEQPKQKLKLDKEALDLRDQLLKAKQRRDARMLLQQRQNESKREKAMRLTAEVLNIPRTLMTIGDFSGLLRQNLFFSAGHPMMTARNTPDMFKSFASQKVYDRWFADLESSPRYNEMKESRLAIADTLSHDLTKREEAFMSTLAERIPILGKTIVKGSERSYTMLLNKMRVDMYNYFADAMEKRGLTVENSPKQYKAMAEYINNATGRSDFGENLNRIAPILSATFFSPRLIASRVNMLTYWAQPRFWKTLPKEARVDYFRNWISLLAIGGTILAMAKMAGADVEDDPRSSDFGKIKSGNTRWDIWGGAQPYVRTVAQVVSGQRKSTNTGQMYSLTGDDVFGETRSGVITDFFRNKLAPVPAAAIDILSGRTSIGDKIVYEFGDVGDKEISIKDYITERLLPMTITGTQEALKDQGVKALLTVGVPSTFGVGTQTYEPKKSSTKMPRPPMPPKPKMPD